MILRERPSGLKLFLLLRGSIMPRISRVLLFNIALATVVTFTHGMLFQFKVTLTAIPFTLIGLPLAIFLLVLCSRNLARQCLHLIDAPAAGQDDPRPRMLRRAVAFCHALRLQLRASHDTGPVQALLEPAEWAAVAGSRSRHSAIMMHIGADLAACRRQGLVDGPLAAQIDDTLCAMTGAAASCERISGTPVPFSYTLLLHRTAYIYCFLLPFGLVDTTGALTPLVVGVVAYTFFGLDALGDEIEEPFGTEPNDLPLDALCRTIEIQMIEAQGETDLPPPLKPVDYCLL